LEWDVFIRRLLHTPGPLSEPGVMKLGSLDYLTSEDSDFSIFSISFKASLMVESTVL
jgi:hypothetical protein